MTEDIKNIEEILLPQYLQEKWKIVECNIKRLTAPGENYGSLMLAVDLKIKNNEDGNKEVVHAVAKAVPPSKFIQKMFQSHFTFRKELGFYSTVVPTLKEFLCENGIENLLNFFPEFYGGRIGINSEIDSFDDHAVILLENLKVHGYGCADRIKGFDLETSKSILKDLAVFHAVPIALKLKNPEVLQKKIMPFINNIKIFDQITEEIADKMIEEKLNIAKENKETISLQGRIREALRLSHKSRKDIHHLREPFATIVHSDFWVNNVMNKNVENKTVQNKIVDFQMTEYGSPAKDLIFFIFNSIENDTVVQHYDELILTYHRTFVKTLERLHINIKQFSLEELTKEINFTVKEIVFFQMLMMLRPIFATEKDVKCVDNLNEQDLMVEADISPEHKAKLWMIVLEFAKRNWI